MMFAADNIRLRALEPEDLEWLYSIEMMKSCGNGGVRMFPIPVIP